MSAIDRPARRVALVAVLLLIAAACGGSDFESANDGGGGDGGGGGSEAAAAGTEGTGGGGGAGELQLAGFASSAAEDEELRRILSEYEGADVTFNPSPDYDTTLQAALAGGQPPDVFYVDAARIPDLVTAGTLAPVDGNVDDPDDFYEPLVQSFTYDGTWYCPAKDFSTLALQYNTDMLEEAGVEPPTTWDELRAAAEALTTDDVAGLVVGAEWFRWGVFALQAGGDIVNDELTEMTADSEPVRQGLQFMADLHADGLAKTPAEVDAGWAGEAFGQGKAAMTIEGNWLAPALDNDFPDLPWAVTTLPEGPDGQGTFSFTVCYAVAQSAPDPQASWDLVNYLVAPENQLDFTEDFSVMPSRPSVREQWVESHPDLQAFVDSADFAQTPAYVPGFQGVLDELNNGIQSIAAGDGSVDAVVTSVQSIGQGVLDQAQ